MLILQNLNILLNKLLFSARRLRCGITRDENRSGCLSLNASCSIKQCLLEECSLLHRKPALSIDLLFYIYIYNRDGDVACANWMLSSSLLNSLLLTSTCH